MIFSTDYSEGFGGKYGVQSDRVDESAVGYEHKEKLSVHDSQKGAFVIVLSLLCLVSDSSL